ncbi:MAG: efflux RND transporter periplasmic adaptor subunit [Planctomycetes bacterium]|nr:efflux RND transporter periplasmic adaptor subunit [Planctomycetota bacterium]
MRRALYVTLVLLLLASGGLGVWYWQAQASPRTIFRTAAAERGPFLAVIAATGPIQPEEVIDVGAQVAGRIERFGIDPRSLQQTAWLSALTGFPSGNGLGGVLLGGLIMPKPIDYRSPVEEGTILAQIDPVLYQSRVDRSRADLQRAQADLLQMQAKLTQAERDWARAQDLYNRKAISQSDHDLARASYDTAVSNLGVGKAAIAQAHAVLQEADTNLGYTTIRSPVKGVIIERRVNVGQTVVASLNAPSLFLIAKDIKRLQIWASVNEADIGHIKPGQAVRFNVDAFPQDEFVGQVNKDQPRLNANMNQNVVTYTVVVNTDNAHGRLLPYMTANVKFLAHQQDNALLVTNAALRWRPKMNQVAPDARKAYARSGKQNRSSPRMVKSAAERERHDMGTVWIVDDGFVRPIRVAIGMSDGAMTQVLGGDLREGMELVVGEDRVEAAGDEHNPFSVKMFGGKK